MKPDPHCRIGRVRPKLNLVLMPHRGGSLDIIAALRRHAEMIASFYPETMAGFAIVAWDFKGNWSRGDRFHRSSPVTETMLPAFVGEVLRRDITAEVVGDVLRGKL